jgi:hypothetical protein
MATRIIWAGELERYLAQEAGIISMAVINNAPTVCKSNPMVKPRAMAKPILMARVGTFSLVANSSLINVVNSERQKRTVNTPTPRAAAAVVIISPHVRARISPNKKPVRDNGGRSIRASTTRPRARLPWEKIAKIESMETFDRKGIKVNIMARPTQKRLKTSWDGNCHIKENASPKRALWEMVSPKKARRRHTMTDPRGPARQENTRPIIRAFRIKSSNMITTLIAKAIMLMVVIMVIWQHFGSHIMGE